MTRRIHIYRAADGALVSDLPAIGRAIRELSEKALGGTLTVPASSGACRRVGALELEMCSIDDAGLYQIELADVTQKPEADALAVNARICERGLRCVPTSKADAEPEERYILGLVLEPTDGTDGAPFKPDTQSDIYSAADVRKTAHGWMENYGQVDLGHSWVPVANDQVRILESYLAPCDFDIGEGDNVYHVLKGTWLLALRVLDENIWKAIKSGKIGAYSVGGLASREPVPPEEIPEGGAA